MTRMNRIGGAIAALGSVLAASAWIGATGSVATPARLAQLTWLAGNWKGGEGAVTLEERWTTPGGGAMLAVARVIKGDRMVAFEFLRIVERDGTLFYVAQPNGRPPTEFTLTAIGEQRATFENPAHDFPKMIVYERGANDTLEARISDGGSKVQTFRFRLAP